MLMLDTFPTLECTQDASAPVRVCRADGSEVPVRLRLLGFEGCELESDERFECGEEIRIHLYRMGWIRSRIASCRSGLIEVEFIKDCPV